MSDGLSNKEVYDTYQDSNGFIWLTVRNDLNRFDGYQFINNSDLVNSTSPILQNLPSKNDLAQIEKLGEKHFIIRYLNENSIFDFINTDNFQLIQYNVDSIFPHTTIVAFTPIPYTTKIAIVCLEDTHLTLYNYNLITQFIEKKSIYNISDICKLDNNNAALIAATSKLVYFYIQGLPLICFDSNKNNVLEIFNLDVEISILKVFGDHELYFTKKNKKGLWLYNNSLNIIHSIPSADSINHINNMWIDQQGNIIIGNANNQYYKELFLIQKKNRNAKSLKNIIEFEPKLIQIRGTNFINQLMVSSYNGFYIYSNNKKNFKTRLNQNLKNGEYGHVLRGMVEDDKGQLFIAEEGNQWYKLNTENDSILKVYKTCNIPNAIPGCIKMNGNNIWGVNAISTIDKNIFCLNTSNEKTKNWNLPNINFKIRDLIIQDNKNPLYFGYDKSTDTVAIWEFNTKNETWQPFSINEKLTGPAIHQVLDDHLGNIWIATTSGLFLLSLEKHQIKKIDFGTLEDPSTDIILHSLSFQSSTGYLFIGSEKGLWIYNPKLNKYISHFTKEINGLSNNIIEGIIPINHDHLLLSTWFGLCYFNLNTLTSTNYYEKDGLANNEFNRLSFHKSKNGKFYFGGINGLTIIELSNLFQDSSLSQVNLSQFYKYDNKVGKEIKIISNLNHLNNVTIEPNDQYFGFDFMYPDFIEPRLNQFQTWLEGFELGWQKPSNLHNIRYDRLPKGDYTLHIRAIQKSNKELAIQIKVKEHFYESKWFIPSILFVLFASILGIINYRKRKQRKEDLEQHQIKQKFKDLEVQILRSQLNPHFIFNALTSIQYYIQNNESQLAEEYLNKFAKLMRLFLESSKLKFMTLVEELNLLKLYTELELLRFDNQFKVSFEVNMDLDISSILLPSNLLQPFVENAIVHGLRNKDKDGKLTIQFKLDETNQFLIVNIEDNGIGRKKAEEIKNRTKSKHISRGTQLVEDRIELFKNSDDFDIQVFTTDLFDIDGNSIGTRVHIKIPRLDEDK